ncbi:MAG: hypothetical protein WDN76_06290 [Alphaproteobacteria bacterium]
MSALLSAAREIYQPPAFDLAKVRRVLHVAAADLHSVLFVPKIMERLRQEAPGIELSFTTTPATFSGGSRTASLIWSLQTRKPLCRRARSQR